LFKETIFPFKIGTAHSGTPVQDNEDPIPSSLFPSIIPDSSQDDAPDNSPSLEVVHQPIPPLTSTYNQSSPIYNGVTLSPSSSPLPSDDQLTTFDFPILS